MLDVVNKFRNNSNQEEADAMAKYMKGQFKFLGVKSNKRKELQKDFLKSLNTKETINKVWVLQLWSYEEREFQYLAMDYLVKKKKALTKEHIQLIETLILTKSWWDTVDLLASTLVGHICKEYPELVSEYIVPWATHENMWLRRTAILYQLKYKEQVDVDILEYAIEKNSNDNDFFIRKAIGWALRQYSKSNPQWVKEFIKTHELSNLSVKEGSKYI